MKIAIIGATGFLGSNILKLIPKKILESTGHSVLNGILLGIKTRVQQQLIKDFTNWCSLN